MNYADLIRLYFERSTALQWYWTLYVVVLGGLLAFSSLRQRRAFFTALLVSILYICFAYKNLGAIEDVTLQRAAVANSIRDYQVTSMDTVDVGALRQKIEPTLVSSTVGSVRSFHVFCDVLTILTLWAMEWRRGHLRTSGPNSSHSEP